MSKEEIAQRAVEYGRKPENADGISIHIISKEIEEYANSVADKKVREALEGMLSDVAISDSESLTRDDLYGFIRSKLTPNNKTK